ncbi:MAG: division/cell wall cluster transcriptional repressor MraZ [Acidimicrobiales bacterium]
MAAARFFGRFEHSLDVKGRVILPAKFRATFAHGGYLTLFHEGCLALWMSEEFERQMVAMHEAAALGRAERNLARVWASGSYEVEVDRQGRMAIPADLRKFAGLTGDVLINGAIDRVELWDPAVWEARIMPAEPGSIDGVEEKTSQ